MRFFEGLFVFLLGTVVHWMWSAYFPAFGLAPNILLVLTVAVASHSGPVAGQCYGFAWGLFLDVIGVHVFGLNALLFTIAAYFVGMLRRQMDVASAPSQLMLVGLLSPAVLLCYGLAGLIFEHSFLWCGWKVFLLQPVFNCAVSPFAFAFVRKAVRF